MRSRLKVQMLLVGVVCVGAVLAPLAAGAGDAPKPARALVDAAVERAKKEQKAVMVVFHASWCGWCHRLENFMAEPDVRPLFEANYAIVRVDVLESKDKKASLENPGGDSLLAQYGGAKSGIPFYAVLDATGKKVADSNALPGGQNIGYPGSPEEIAAFMGILQRTAPHLTADQRDHLAERLRKAAPH